MSVCGRLGRWIEASIWKISITEEFNILVTVIIQSKRSLCELPTANKEDKINSSISEMILSLELDKKKRKKNRKVSKLEQKKKIFRAIFGLLFHSDYVFRSSYFSSYLFFCPCGNWDDCLVGVKYPWNTKRMWLRRFQLIDGKLFVSEMSFGDLVLSNKIVSNRYWRGFCGIDGGSVWIFIVLEVLWQHCDQQKLRQTRKFIFPNHTSSQIKFSNRILKWKTLKFSLFIWKKSHKSD